MRILHVGNGNQKHRGARFYDVGTKLNNGFIRNGHNVLFMSDRDVARAATPLGARKLGVKKTNQYFLDMCHNFQPELIVLGHADIITGESLKEARDMLPLLKILQFNVDPIFRDHNITQIRSKLDVVDATFITTAGDALKAFSTPHGKVSFMPNPIDPSMECHRAHEKNNLPHDVFWALRATKGSFDGDARIETPLFLEKSGKIKLDYHGMNGKDELFGAAYYQRMSQAKMALNISVIRTYGHTPIATPEQVYLYSSDRISHLMGNGLLTFTTRGNQLEELFEEDKEIIFFEEKEELLEKILYFNAHDDKRKAVAAAGWQKSHQHYNVEHVARYLIETTFGYDLQHDYAWPTTTY